jgi:hypothetical protein
MFKPAGQVEKLPEMPMMLEVKKVKRAKTTMERAHAIPQPLALPRSNISI